MDTKKPSPQSPEAPREILRNFRKYLHLESKNENYNEKRCLLALREATEATTWRVQGRGGRVVLSSARPAYGNTVLLLRDPGSGKPRKATRETAHSPLTPAKISRA